MGEGQRVLSQLPGRAWCAVCCLRVSRRPPARVPACPPVDLHQVEIPNVDDHISKLEHMGKETVKKLQDIHGSALAAGIDISVPDNRINKGALRGCGCECVHVGGGAGEGGGACWRVVTTWRRPSWALGALGSRCSRQGWRPG